MNKEKANRLWGQSGHWWSKHNWEQCSSYLSVSFLLTVCVVNTGEQSRAEQQMDSLRLLRLPFFLEKLINLCPGSLGDCAVHDSPAAPFNGPCLFLFVLGDLYLVWFSFWNANFDYSDHSDHSELALSAGYLFIVHCGTAQIPQLIGSSRERFLFVSLLLFSRLLLLLLLLFVCFIVKYQCNNNNNSTTNEANI